MRRPETTQSGPGVSRRSDYARPRLLNPFRRHSPASKQLPRQRSSTPQARPGGSASAPGPSRPASRPRAGCKRPDRDPAADHALADVVLRLARQAELDLVVEKRAEALAGAASVRAPLTPTQRCAHRAHRVVDLAAGRGGQRKLSIARPAAPAGLRRIGRGQHIRKVEEGVGFLFQQLDATDDLANAASPQPRQMLAHLLGNEEEIVDYMLRPAVELGPQVLALSRYSRGTRVEVALPRHVAAERDQQAGAEPELLSAEQRGDHDVAAVAQPTVGAQAHALAQSIRDEHLLGLGQAELPRSPGVLDRRERRRPGAAVVAGDEDVVGPGLGDSGGDGADAGLGYELDADARTGVHGLQVM